MTLLGSATTTLLVFPRGNHSVEVPGGIDDEGRWRFPRKAPGMFEAIDAWVRGNILIAPQPAALVLGPEVLASVNENGGRVRVEPSVVRTGETIVVAWNDSWAGRTPGTFTSRRLSTVSTSWPDVPGDLEYAPVHRNFSDYITVYTDGRRGVAAWTDGRTGAPRIMVRTFELR